MSHNERAAIGGRFTDEIDHVAKMAAEAKSASGDHGSLVDDRGCVIRPATAEEAERAAEAFLRTGEFAVIVDGRKFYVD